MNSNAVNLQSVLFIPSGAACHLAYFSFSVSFITYFGYLCTIKKTRNGHSDPGASSTSQEQLGRSLCIITPIASLLAIRSTPAPATEPWCVPAPATEVKVCLFAGTEMSARHLYDPGAALLAPFPLPA